MSQLKRFNAPMRKTVERAKPIMQLTSGNEQIYSRLGVAWRHRRLAQRAPAAFPDAADRPNTMQLELLSR
jgi:hypothetical protein